MNLISPPFLSMAVAKVCLRTCGVTFFWIPALLAAFLIIRSIVEVSNLFPLRLTRSDGVSTSRIFLGLQIFPYEGNGCIGKQHYPVPVPLSGLYVQDAFLKVHILSVQVA